MQDVPAQLEEVHHESLIAPSAASERSLPQRANPLASIAGLFGFQSPEDDGDTAGPFAIQGQTR